ncbi:unnamed protein product [Clavelina lepadiformis]|uniref:Pitrilysin metalloproteinase 1 n=1 Tax=Clavelina lepadiformis TaxID=159417 RepID=A0ABP0FXV9_CLALP
MSLLKANWSLLSRQKRFLSSSAVRPVLYKVGQVLHDYEVKRVVDVPELFTTAVELEHTKTGSQHLHLARDDKNNVFNVGLRTTPMNSTGVAHVLEHVALCGSASFPVRDPFFKMLNRSMSSFMNAMTGADYTMYPFSTQNAKDFRNLLLVYLDSVFFPRIRKMDFLQEGWRLEHEKIDDKLSPIIFKGVVFNEMKGMMSDPSYLYGTALQNKLLPDHTYGFCSGGKPMDIPNLTWEDLQNFHATHYHPSNANFITYGDIPMEIHLEQINEQVMKKFDKINPDTEVPLQAPWPQQRTATTNSPPDPMAANPEKQTTISFSYLLPEVSNVFESFVAYVLCTLVIDGPSSPFYKALIESGLGSDYSPNTGYHSHMRQAIFSIGLQGIDKNDVSKVENLMEKTIDDVIRDGFTSERIESILHRIELQIKHQSSMFGLGLSFNIIPTWQHGADPVESLRIDQTVKKFREKLEVDPEFLRNKCKEYFKSNTHRLSLTMNPDSEFSSKMESTEKKMLQERIEKLSDEDKDLIFKQGQELLENQHFMEDLSCLPTLKVSDIPSKQVQHDVGVKFSREKTMPSIMTCPQPTNGLTYFNNVIPINELREGLMTYVPLFCDVLTQMGTESTDYVTFSQREDLFTGGLNASVTSSSVYDAMETETSVRLSSHCLDRNTSKMFDLWRELFHEVKFDDVNRLRTLIRQRAQELANGVSFRGAMFAMRSGAQHLAPSAKYEEKFAGLTQVNLMKELADQDDLSDVISKLRQIGDYVLHKNVTTQGERYALHATPDSMETAEKLLEAFQIGKPGMEPSHVQLQSELLQNGDLVYVLPPDGVLSRHVRWNKFQQNCSRTDHNLPLAVNHVSMCVPTSSTYAKDDSAHLRLLARLATNKFLHREIREKGGAYGGGARHGDDGIFRFYSYRDPNVTKTIEAFEKGVDWLISGDFDQQDIDEAKLAVFQSVDSPVSPCDRGMSYFLDGLPHQIKQKHRDQLLLVGKDELIDTAKRRLVGCDASIAVIGPGDAESNKN